MIKINKTISIDTETIQRNIILNKYTSLKKVKYASGSISDKKDIEVYLKSKLPEALALILLNSSPNCYIEKLRVFGKWEDKKETVCIANVISIPNKMENIYILLSYDLYDYDSEYKYNNPKYNGWVNDSLYKSITAESIYFNVNKPKNSKK